VSTSTKWLTRPPRPDARLRLFCLPYAGGGSGIFRGWADVADSWIDPVPVQLPGRDARLMEKPIADVNTLVELLAASLMPYVDQPYALFGHSVGALVCFDLCRRLREYGAPAPVRLFVSAYRAPQVSRRGKTLHRLSDSDFVQELRDLQGTPEAVLNNRELMQILLPVMRADFELHETYVYKPGPALDCPISAYGGLQDRHVTEADLRAWREHTASSFIFRFLPGDHFFVHSARKHILSWISHDLDDPFARPAGNIFPEFAVSESRAP
jgi:medium-chain acyl-[acyl-carrier-protein] hydrolase